MAKDRKIDVVILGLLAHENLEKVLDQEDHIHFYLTVMFGIETYGAYLRWCSKAKKILKEK